ncbi:hypothetical protein [Acinetobacter sp. NIPH 2699]|uniref:hypothetical protein n=1 Tax=Acinetobacter sp. NIPH 2699 TaxID=2923433 RepID=UPI001F4A11EE|nr:hypothetical protein [Acinetobacter sp. NIPH 2699]MCH7335192.1 hypothetical protein [Acinetobacter sp. NIPH 2699]
MNKNSKLILLIVFICIFITFIYWLAPKIQSKENVGIPLDKSSLPETPSTVSNQSNDSNLQNIKIDKFEPKTIWKDKTLNINGKNLHYKFGEGNPIETALSPEEYLPKGEKDGIPYVTPKTEENLLNFLSDEDLPAVLDKCENYNRYEMQKLNPNIPVNQLPILLQPTDFDIENILIVDEKTGRKEINQPLVNQINEFMNLLSNPLSGTEFSDKCAGIAYKESIERIKNKYYEFTKSYVNTGDALPSETWTNK